MFYRIKYIIERRNDGEKDEFSAKGVKEGLRECVTGASKGNFGGWWKRDVRAF